MFPNRANPHCSSSSLSRPLHLHQRPPSATSPSPIAPPSTKFGSPVLLRHRTAGEKEAATAPPSKRKRPPSRHRPALVAASVAPPSLLCCGLLRATAALCVRRAPSVVHSSPHFATVPHSHLALLLRVTAPASILRLVRQFCPGPQYRGCASSSIVIQFSRSQ
ncbi:hypothetical protein DEO72_LG6g747 [Vigna unguiculata]|uniref:Uncharacterized protein n=1 Tax=Vigna unguiculata TaxID=3917 RepID=A0A4D6M4F6_VIGUN|nr:hypothetical protein DEO72_LG6g747 [Vigna unguiculata]